VRARLVVPALAGVAAMLAITAAESPAAPPRSGAQPAQQAALPPARRVVQRAATSSGPAAGPSRVTLAAVRAYWTRERMAAARPAQEPDAGIGPALADGVRFTRPSALRTYLRTLAPGRAAAQSPGRGAPWTGGGAVVRTTGKVFFSLGADDYACSGSSVDSLDRSTVLTAGHCVVDPESGTTATNWVFVPGYVDGRAPYGIFPATHLATTAGWRTAEDFDVDLAFANVGPNAAGRLLVDAVGGQAIAFGTARGQGTFAFGYPAAAPWTGERLVYCSGVVVQDTTSVPSTDQGMSCTMTPGSSGGPWFSRFDPRTGRGTLTSLTSFSYSDRPGVLWGPYLGSVAQALFASVASTTTA